MSEHRRIEQKRRVGSASFASHHWPIDTRPERAQTIRRVIRDASCPVIVFRVQATIGVCARKANVNSDRTYHEIYAWFQP